ncbi:MAG: acetylornithine aminotransferase [Legionellales bacterium RIFCSPHIGHO2_12_FULL_37_14]|nr:MAG: acetylornithine aminotransferase [Legionellales bacterium RIFCSPHIGHO2_12_FULL_37_14]
MINRVTAYSPLPIAITHGKGVWVYDENNNKYLDSFAGIAVNGLGHAHKEFVKVVQDQVARIIHSSNTVRILEQEALAERLCKLTGFVQTFFSNSGAEANEAALKLARLYGKQKGIESANLIVMDQAFHGRTLAMLSASSNRKIQAGFEPLVSGFIRAPFNDCSAIEKIAEHRNDIVGIMLEPIQGEGGVIVPADSYLNELAALCKKHDWLLILDEIQTGNGRTGSYFSYMSHNIMPDIVTTAKGLANGIPIGACLIGKRAANLFKPGNHGSTFGGNPLACKAALTVLEIIERDNLCQRAYTLGLRLKAQLQEVLANFPMVQAIRGKGLMLGVELDREALSLKTIALQHGLLLNVTGEKVVRLLPALIMSDEEADEMVKRLVLSLQDFAGVPQKG